MILPHGRTLLFRLLAEAGRRMPGMYYAWLCGRARVGEVLGRVARRVGR